MSSFFTLINKKPNVCIYVHKWDVHCQGNPVTEAARFVTGPDQKNNVTFLQVNVYITPTKTL